jgi:SH3 domain-containing YSC84-like protein 1
MQRTAFAAAAVFATVTAHAVTAIPASEAARLTAAARVTQDIRAAIPQEYWTRARCIAVVPALQKGAIAAGGVFGKGVLSCRAGDGWSAPFFVDLAKGRSGLQTGADQADVVLLVMNESGAQKLLQNDINLGADASVALGPHDSRGADAARAAEIVGYARDHGLFVGIDLSGALLRADDQANREIYGGKASARTILATREISAPTQATAFLNALGAGSAAPATRAPADRPAPSSSATQPPVPAPAPMPAPVPELPPPANTSNLRARIVNMQQEWDRLLSDSQPSAVGTTGTDAAPSAAPGGTITVDRARLAQLRQQLDALLTTLDGR